MIRQISKRVRKFIKSRKPIAFSIYEDDVFLVSYPRSGNTWVRFLLSNLQGYSQRDPVDFYSVHQIIPDLDIRQHEEIIRQLPPPRIIKSHSPYRKDFPRVIYLVRDGRNVYASYYDYLSKQDMFHGTFAEMLRDSDNLQYGSWQNHVLAWWNNIHQENFILVRYEDLRQDTLKELERMATFLGLSPTIEQYNWAIEWSSLPKMKQFEKTKGRPYGHPDYRFARSGKISGRKAEFDDTCKEIFKQKAGDWLIKLGYENGLDW